MILECIDPFEASEKFIYTVTGNEMSGDRIMSNDRVLILQGDTVRKDEIALVLFRSVPTLRRIKKIDGMYKIIPSNINFPIELVRNKDIIIVGKVIEVIFRL